MAESYSVEAVLSAVDSKFTSTFESAAKSVDGASAQISKSIDQISKVTAVAGAAITAMGVKSLKSFGDFEASLNKAAIIAGGTSKNIGELADVANRMGAELPLSAQDAADAMVAMAQDGASIDSIKEEFPAIAKAATAAGSDLQTTASVVQQSMNIWGKSLGSPIKAASILTQVANMSNALIEDMQQALATIGGTANLAGMGMDTTAEAIGLLTNRGYSAAQASQDLNHAVLQMVAPSKVASAQMADLGLSFTDAEGNMKPFPKVLEDVNTSLDGLKPDERAAALKKLFGTAGMAAIAPLLDTISTSSKSTTVSWAAFNDELQKTSGTVDAATNSLNTQAADMQNNLGSKIEQVGGNWESLRNSAMASSSGVSSAILDMINSTLELANNSDTAFGQLTQGVLGLTTVIGPAMTGFAGFAGQMNAINNFLGIGSIKAGSFGKSLSSMTSLSGVSSVLDGVQTGVHSLGGAMSAAGGPIELLKGKLSSIPSVTNNVLAAFKGVQLTGSNGFKSLNSSMQSVVGTIASSSVAFSGLNNSISNVVGRMPVLSTLGQEIKSAFSFGELPGMVGNAFSQIQSKLIPLQGLFSNLGSGLTSGLSKSFDLGMTITQTGLSTMGTLMTGALSIVGPAAILALLVAGLGLANQQFGTQINTMIQTATTQGPMVISNFVNGIVTALPALIQTGATMLTSILNAITANLPIIIQGGVQIITTLVTSLSNSNSGLLTAALNMIMTLVTGLAQALPQIMSAGITILLALINGIVQNLPTLINSGMQMIQTLANGLLQNMNQIINGALQIVDGLATGISNNLPTILAAALKIIISIVQGLVNNINKLIDAALKIVMALADALIDNLDLIIDAAIKLTMALMNGLIDNIDKIINAGIKLVLALMNALMEHAPQLINAAVKLVSALVNGLISNLPKLVSAAAKLALGIAKSIWDHKGDMAKAGVDLILGLAKGIASAASNAVQAAVKVAKGLLKSVKGALGIHSPSKVMANEVGRYIPAGVGVGIMDNLKFVSDAASAIQSASMVTIPAVDQSPFNASLKSLNNQLKTTNLDAALDVNYSKSLTVEVPVNLDGREVARVTAKPMRQELDKIDSSRNRVQGYR